MRSRDLGLWDYLYLFLLGLAVPVGIFHLVQGRYGQAVIAAGAVTIGLGFLFLARSESAANQAVAEAAPRRSDARPAGRVPQTKRSRESRLETRQTDGRMRHWLSRSVVSGFAATGVMTLTIIFGYLFVRTVGDSAAGDSTLRGWFQALGDNTLTDSAESNLPLVLVIHFTAGIVWAIIYGALAESRLSGPGWRRGVIFSLVPWLFSVVVFLPLTGAGFFGLGLDAGVLPAVGNLILHLAYGSTLGLVYASSGVLSEGEAKDDVVEVTILQQAERLMAIGLVPGVVVGTLIGLLGSNFLAPGTDAAVVSVVSGAIGGIVGVLIGSFVGLSPAAPDRS